MEISDIWKWATHYSVVNAALLMSGHNPEDFHDSDPDNYYRTAPGYLAAKTALVTSIESGGLETAKIVYDEPGYSGISEINIFQTTVSVGDLDRFVKAAGGACRIFERIDRSGKPSSDPASQFFSPKLNAANKAWMAVTQEPERLRGKSPKQALKKWLQENAAELGLVKPDGSINEDGIDQISKVANWKPEGGATATPSASSAQAPVFLPPTPSRSPTRAKSIASFLADLDDEIPF